MHQPGYGGPGQGQPGYGQPGYGHQPPPAGPPGFGPPPPAYAPHVPNAPHPSYPARTPPAPQAPFGPDFLAADRHNSVVVDAQGVFFEMRGLTAEFPWHVVRSAHYRPSPDGKALMVAVVHVDGRVFECVVLAKRGGSLQEWLGQLAAVLGHYRPMG
ncbi:hypothetical protein ACFOZ0_22055 [Streptomyces yaanensis]|uniref:Uncharacterized protein n=1 Tax=Streptomyces yaanensis TaxID=1142239 RepID=A0ABV7SHR0_9ACTN|nr:hypothetical protein [Streptomyces sp. CGMCC 4.7035]WNB97488.1 hypothetical protein Q2K21_05035 [Streptomyces sp. CGMCC 4.7035]